jgi:uncharacterized protein (DUF169 family)
MPVTAQLLSRLSDVGVAARAVAVAFLDSPPEGLRRLDGPQPASCSYWKVAAEGRAFYTTPADHVNCPIGSFTHGAVLPAEGQRELDAMIQTMIELKYVRAEEVAALPHRTDPLGVVAYAPLTQARFEPDVVIFRGNVRQIMLLTEAARAAGAFEDAVMGRPACAMLPRALAARAGVASVGCIGNRVYTGLGDDELYLTVPGATLGALLEHLPATLDANRTLEQFHRERAARLG